MKHYPLTFLLLGLTITCCGWGFFAHQQINQLACLTLPTGMIRFYKSNIRYITEHAVDPDKRRYLDTAEAPRHYLDIEDYETHPDSIPEKWQDALNRYGAKKLQTSGIVPWQIQRTYFNLVKAFKEKDSVKILKYSSDLGHYIGDAHVPLHTTSNHNGQLTNQTGIHAFWESRVPELGIKDYNLYAGKARYIENPLKAAWTIVKHTHTLVDSVLKLEAALSAEFPSDRKYTYSERNHLVIKQYSDAYTLGYQKMLNGMVERQMRKSINAIGSFWLTAWVDAGQPALDHFKQVKSSKKENELAKAAEEQAMKGKLIGREL